MAEGHLSQPAIRNNEWQALAAPRLGEWTPTRSVSVIVPAYNPRHLDHVLAGLAGQSYPDHLLEVVVVDDGSTPPVRLPEVRPERTRLLQTADGWGRAASCHTGALRSDGEVLHWLDADMVVSREQVEAQLRWHHLVDYAVVLGEKLFGPIDALDHVTPERLRAAIALGQTPWSLTTADVSSHAWVDEIHHRTERLAMAGYRAMRAHVGASASVSRDLYRASGGLPVGLKLGEDIVLGYRLREAGAVFIPDREAVALHLGETNVMRQEAAINRYNKPFITQLVPEFRGHRLRVGRNYDVPYVEVVVPASGADHETVAGAVNAQLAGTVPDLLVTLVANWDALTDGRRRVLDDDAIDLRMLRATFDSEPRVRLTGALDDRSPATFRLTLPAPDCYPAGDGLESLLQTMEERHLGVVTVDLGDVGVARLERTASVARAGRVAAGGENPDSALAAVTLIETVTRDDAGFVTAADAPRIRQVRGLVPWGVKQAGSGGPGQ